jgi:site-specific recombinase XerD
VQSTHSAHARKNCVNFAFTSPVITIFVRHAASCKSADPFGKRRDCRKHFRWTSNGKQHQLGAGTRSWAEAEELKTQLAAQLAGRPPEPKPEEAVRTIRDAAAAFYADRAVRGVSKMTAYLYKHDVEELAGFCERSGIHAVTGITREVLTALCATWGNDDATSQTRARKQDRIGTFIRFCFLSRWIDRRPGMPRIRVNVQPTMPLTPDEYAHLLTVAAQQPEDNRARRRLTLELCALIQLMRYSGLCIRDALTLPRIDFVKCPGLYRVTTSRQKTGTHVSVPIPPDVAREVLTATTHPEYVFWDGVTDQRKLTGAWVTRMSKAFTRAGLADACFMKSHRLRDTFAVDLLEKGVPLEEVSKLLGHDSIKTTEKSYAKWVKGRQDRLDSLVTGTWGAPS